MRDTNALEAHKADQNLTVSIGSPLEFDSLSGGDAAFLRKWGALGGDAFSGIGVPWGIAAYVDEIYVVDGTNDCVQVFSTAGRFQRSFGSPGTGDGQFVEPRGIAVYGGEVYVTDRGNDCVQVFNTAGTFLRKWTALGLDGIVGYAGEIYVVRERFYLTVYNTIGIFQRSWITYVGACAITEYNGEIYVYVGGPESIPPVAKVMVFSVAGVLQREFGSYGVEKVDGTFIGYTLGLAGLAQEIYVAESATGYERIQVFDTAGVFQRKWGSPGSADGQFSHPYGMTQYGGDIYVSDSGNLRIQVFNPAGAFQRDFGQSVSGDGLLSGPRAIVGYSGEVYVADSDNQRIEVFTTAGTYQRQWGTAGTGDGQFAAPFGVTFYGTEIYVVDRNNNRVQVFNVTGVFQRKWGSSGSGDGQFSVPQGIVAYGGELYVTEYSGNRVQVFNSSGVFQRKWGSSGSGDGQFSGAFGIAEYGGELYVTDFDNHRVQVFNSSGVFQRKWGSNGFGDGQFVYPTGIAAYNGEIYVLDRNNNRVQVFDTAGVFQRKFGSLGTGDGQFSYPEGVAVFGTELYVVDTNNHRIQVFSFGSIPVSAPEDVAVDGTDVVVTDRGNDRVLRYTNAGAFDSAFGSSGSGNGQLNAPKGIAVDSSGNAYVVDSGNSRVQKFTSGGLYFTQWGSSGSGDGQFTSPTRIFVDSADNVYVVDSGGHRIQKFDSSGAFLRKFGSNGAAVGYLASPVSVAANATESLIYVSDTGNNRVQVFYEFGDDHATYKTTFGEFGSGANRQMSAPEGIDLDADGHLYLADTGNNRIYKLASRGKVAAVYGSYGVSAGQFDAPSGIAVSGNHVFVVDRGNNRIQRLTQSVSAEDAASAQTAFKLKLTSRVGGSSEVSMGVPDRGLHVPDLGAIDMGVPTSELSPDVTVIKRTPAYFSDIRRALEKLAASGAFTNPDTGLVYDWTEGDENLLRRAMAGKHPHFGVTEVSGDAKRDWTRGALNYTAIADLDIGELHHVIERLKAATVGAVT